MWILLLGDRTANLQTSCQGFDADLLLDSRHFPFLGERSIHSPPASFTHDAWASSPLVLESSSQKVKSNNPCKVRGTKIFQDMLSMPIGAAQIKRCHDARGLIHIAVVTVENGSK